MALTRTKCVERLLPLLERGTVPVVTGFNGATPDGRPTTLGRGGSDFSASILTAALEAEELWIWTDVDGIMTADPRLVADVAVLDKLSYAEAAELAYNGAEKSCTPGLWLLWLKSKFLSGAKTASRQKSPEPR